MKKLLLTFAGVLIAATSLLATPACSTFTPTYQSLIDAGSAGCTVGDLLFNNFKSASSFTGTGKIQTASGISFTLDEPGLSSQTGDKIYGFEFNPNLAVLGIGSQDVILQYDILAPYAKITSNHLLLTGIATAGAFISVAEGPNCGQKIVGGTCYFQPTLTATNLAPHQDSEHIGPFIALHIFKDINVLSTRENSFASVSNVRDAVDESAPEPVSFVLFGGGLLALGLYKRNKTNVNKNHRHV